MGYECYIREEATRRECPTPIAWVSQIHPFNLNYHPPSLQSAEDRARIVIFSYTPVENLGENKMFCFTVTQT